MPGRQAHQTVSGLSFDVRPQAMCSRVLVVIDNLPLIHPRSMHRGVKSCISTITIVFRHSTFAGTSHLLRLQLPPVDGCPAFPVRLITWVILLGEYNAVLQAKEPIWEVRSLPSEIQGPPYSRAKVRQGPVGNCSSNMT